MCFSPEASFSVGGALLPAGAYCLWTAWAKDRRLLPLAFMPVGFGAQQIAEGFVWLGLGAGDPVLTRRAALVFLFFALAFWPFWFPFLAVGMETRPGWRQVLIGFAAVTPGWFWVLFYPLVTGPPALLTVEVVHHSVRYSYPDLAVYGYVPRPVLRVLYLLSAVLPMAFGSARFGRLPGLLLLGSVVVAAAAFEYAFVSVWCFFAAVLSVYLCVMFYRLPGRSPGRGSAPVGSAGL